MNLLWSKQRQMSKVHSWKTLLQSILLVLLLICLLLHTSRDAFSSRSPAAFAAKMYLNLESFISQTNKIHLHRNIQLISINSETKQNCRKHLLIQLKCEFLNTGEASKYSEMLKSNQEIYSYSVSKAQCCMPCSHWELLHFMTKS